MKDWTRPRQTKLALIPGQRVDDDDATIPALGDSMPIATRAPPNPPQVVFTVPGDPVPCSRPRAVPLMRDGKAVLGPGGRPIITAFTPTETRHYEQHVQRHARAAFEHCDDWRRVYAKKEAVRIHMHIVRRHWRGDWDNFAKGIADGIANSGLVFFNDNRITEALISMRTDPDDEPRVEVKVERATKDLRMQLWMQIALENGWTPPARPA